MKDLWNQGLEELVQEVAERTAKAQAGHAMALSMEALHELAEQAIPRFDANGVPLIALKMAEMQHRKIN